MNGNLDLTKLLEGLDNRKLWSPAYGVLWLCCVNKYYNDYPIVTKDCLGKIYSFDKKGIDEYGNYLFPSKYQCDWDKFQEPIDLDTPMMCSDDKVMWTLMFYKEYKENHHYVSRMYTMNVLRYKYMIRFEDFNPNDIEDSIKNYNIQK